MSLQRRVLRFGLLQDGNAEVGVFPQREEILIYCVGFGGLVLHGIGPADLEARGGDWDGTAIVREAHNSLKFRDAVTLA